MPRDDDLEELRGLVDIYGQYRKTKAQAEKARLEVQLWWQQSQQEVELARRRAEQGLELERLEHLSHLSLEMLVLAARTPEQARLLAGLARLNTMKGLSAETILVLAADRDPRLAEALSPVLLKIFESGKAEEYRQLIERLIAMQKEGADRTREDYQQTMRTFTQMFERFADTTVEVARAAAVVRAAAIDTVASAVERERPDLRPHAAPDGTVTILFSDIEGSTVMTERLGDRRMQEVLQAHNGIIRRQAAAHGGFEVKSLGDGFMLAFSSARRSLECAIAIQRSFALYNEEHPEEPILVRIGLHTGEAIKEADDFYGKNVILASRIASQAQGSQILVSSLLKELTESAGEFQFGEGRNLELKGLAAPARVYHVVWQQTESIGAPGRVCPSGHPVTSHTAKFCDQCGASLG